MKTNLVLYRATLASEAHQSNGAVACFAEASTGRG